MSKNGSKWKKQVKVDQDYICPICGKKGTDKSMNIHHKRAKSRGGGNNRENVVAWHKTGHQRYHEMYGNATSDDYGNPI